MKIAYLLGSLNRGGLEILMLDTFKNVSQQNLDCIGIYRKPGILEQEFKETGIKMFYLSYYANKFKYLVELRKLVKQQKITIVHAQQFIDTFIAWIVCFGTNIKIVQTIHGYDFDLNFLNKKLLNFTLKKTSCNIFVSRYQKEYYESIYNLSHEKQKIVHNGISFDKLDRFDYRSIREELNIGNEPILIGSIGNFTTVRDYYTLCRFAKLLIEYKINFQMVFIGKQDDSVPQRYQQCVTYCEDNKLSNNVHFLGSRSDIPNILYQLDAFVYATDHDTFGIAVVEAMAVGIPVFVNDWEVMKEITVDGKYATLYKTKDEKDLLREFMLFLQNKAGYISRAEQASDFVHQQYSIEKHIANLNTLYATL